MAYVDVDTEFGEMYRTVCHHLHSMFPLPMVVLPSAAIQDRDNM